MKKNSKYIFSASLRRVRKRGPTLAGLRLRHRKGSEAQAKTVARLVETIITRPVTGGFDPELLYVECGRCGSPVLWEDGRATRLLDQAGIDPLELDASCILVTDACPACSRQDEYTVRIFGVAKGSAADLPPRLGHA